MTSLVRREGGLTDFLTGWRTEASENCPLSSESLLWGRDPSTFTLFAGRPGISPEFEMSANGSRDVDEAVPLRTKASMLWQHRGDGPEKEP